MPATTTIGAIRDRVRELADIQHSEHIDNDELNRKISAAYQEFVDLLIEYQIHLFESIDDITADGLTCLTDLPEDHYKTLAVEYINGSASDELAYRYPLKELMFAERNRYRCVGPGRGVAYRLLAGQIEITPLPASGQIYRHTYCPAAPDISAMDDDTALDGISGWEEFIVVTAAIACRVKEQSDYSDLQALDQRQRARLAKMAPDRSEAQRIVSTRNDDDDCLYGQSDVWPFGPRGY